MEHAVVRAASVVSLRRRARAGTAQALRVVLLGACIATVQAAAPAPETGDQHREYRFAPTGELIPFRLYVPAGYDGTRPFPLVVALHGGGQDADYVFDETPIKKLAEERGVIVVAPLGYNRFGGYGAFFPIVTTHAAATAALDMVRSASKEAAQRGAGDAPPPERMNDGMQSVKAAPDDYVEVPSSLLSEPTVVENSERDVISVMDQVEREYCVDRARVYLTGNSMGGLGTHHLAAKYAERWAAVAPSGLPVPAWVYPYWRLREQRVAVLYVHGELDNLANSKWSAELAKHARKQGVEADVFIVPGQTHVGGWPAAMPKIFDFFLRHKRASATDTEMGRACGRTGTSR